MSYRPPFEITAKAINLISEISEKIGIITALSDNPIIKNQNDEPINEPTNEPIKLVLGVVRKNPYLSKEMIAAEIGKSRATVTRALVKLQNDGIIRRIGSNKNGHWEIIK